jgi:recombinational DNA repair protein RecT
VLKDGSKNFEYWTVEQIERHRDRYSKGAYDKDGKLTGAWLSSPEWMYKKTVLRQIIKLMPKSVELATALSLDERADVGVSQVFDSIPAELQPQPAEEAEVVNAQPSIAMPQRKSAAPAPAPAEEVQGEANEDWPIEEELAKKGGKK